MSQYRLRVLDNGDSPIIEFRSRSDVDARLDARSLLSNFQRSTGAELWRFDDLVRSFIRVGFVPYALRRRPPPVAA
jgi:hypothetical protein